MRNRFFFLLVLLCAVVGVGMGAMAENAKPTKAPDTTLAQFHAKQGVECRQCHGPGKFKAVTMTKCLTCHGDTKALAQRTANVKPTNPHNSRHYGTEADCNMCHHQHVKSENACAQCHTFKFVVP